MNIIQGITDSPNQQMTLSLPGGTRVALTLYYREQQQSWFFDFVWNGKFTCRGRQLVVSPNVVRQSRLRIPFGLWVYSPNNLEPLSQTAFADGTATLLLLTAAEVLSTEAAVFPGS